MISNSSVKVAALHRQQLGERRAAALLVVRQDHLAHRADAVGIEEHVLGAAQTDAFGAELERDARIIRRIALARTFSLRTLSAHPISVPNSPESAGSCIGTLPASTWPVEPSTVTISPFLERLPAALIGLRRVVDTQRAGAGDARLAHAARDHRRVRGHAAARGEDAFGGVHAVNVFGRGLDAHRG
jgi:hypothetical protein